MRPLGFILLLLLTYACADESQETEKVINYTASQYIAALDELSDDKYPDNPDIEIRHQLDGQFSHHEIVIDKNSNNLYNLHILPNPSNKISDTILLEDVNLLEFIPTFPDYIKEDPYMVKIGLINQEWNRQQVKFLEGQFQIKGSNLESKSIVRVDLARNCLNAYLWEIIAFAKNENGAIRPCYHGWFDFPRELYASLFLQRNKVPFSEHKAYLEDWIDPEQDKINFDLLRTLDNNNTKVLTVENKKLKNLNDAYYPLIGERKKKFKNIINPLVPTSINDFLNDSTLFGTFTPPGFYNTKDPRKTYLSKLGILERVIFNETLSNNTNKDKTFELKFVFSSNFDAAITNMIIGGLDKTKIPSLSIEDAKDGFQMPMGIANHSFYETYDFMQTNHSKENPYYGLLLNENENFMDSHWLGIDGPLLHWDKKKKDMLHVWILSFERHAFVGHYALQL